MAVTPDEHNSLNQSCTVIVVGYSDTITCADETDQLAQDLIYPRFPTLYYWVHAVA